MRYVFDYQCVKRKVITCEVEKYSTTSKNGEKEANNKILLNQNILILFTTKNEKNPTKQFVPHHPNFRCVAKNSRNHVLFYFIIIF